MVEERGYEELCEAVQCFGKAVGLDLELVVSEIGVSVCVVASAVLWWVDSEWIVGGQSVEKESIKSGKGVDSG